MDRALQPVESETFMLNLVIDWKRPPVIEVVLGVQFAPLPNFHNGHLGWFWRLLQKNYPHASDSAPIDVVLEGFGNEPEFGFPSIGFAPIRGDARLRMISGGDSSRMVQLQNGWLVVNWMKREGQGYPGYAGVLREFESVFSEFEKFARAEELGDVTPNLWEVTYIDHIPRGTVWQNFSDLPKVLPGLLGNCGSPHGHVDALSARWSFRLQPRPGRLNVSIQTARSLADPPTDMLVMTSTARGPIDVRGVDTVRDSLNFGKTCVVDTFNSVTSSEARAYWKG